MTSPPMARSRLALVTTLAVAASMLRATAEGAAPTCPQKQVSAEYAQRVRQALVAGRDIWGEDLIRSPAGPAYPAAPRRPNPPCPFPRAGPRGHGRGR